MFINKVIYIFEVLQRSNHTKQNTMNNETLKFLQYRIEAMENKIEKLKVIINEQTDHILNDC